ncbi:MAG: DUF6531 domain-containing protein, partial [Clostridium sp.]
MKGYFKHITIILVMIIITTLVPQKTGGAIERNERQSDNTAIVVGEDEKKREENIKHFKKSDGSYEAVVYEEPVHYLKDNQWMDIDNTLKEEMEDTEVLDILDDNFIKEKNGRGIGKGDKKEKYFSNKSNEISVKIGKSTESRKLVSIKKDKYEIYWNINTPNASRGVAKNLTAEDMTKKLMPNASIEEKKEFEKKLVLNNTQEVSFKNISDGIDLQYIIKGKSLKENIILNKKSDIKEFTFNVHLKNLEPVIDESDKNLIKMIDIESKKVVFYLDAPAMYDADGNGTDKIDIKFEKKNKGYNLKIIPDYDWLNSSERKYPVIIDPIVTTNIDSNFIKDTFIASTDREDKWLNQYNRVGNVPQIGETRTLVKFTGLPNLKTGDVVIDAKIYMHQAIEVSGANGTVNAHEVISDWGAHGGTLWSNQPNIDNTILDTNNSVDKYWSYWNITKSVNNWYRTGRNYGIMLKRDIASSGHTAYWSSDISNLYNYARPNVTIQYTNINGIEDYMNYNAQNIGRAGTGYVNTYNGNLVISHDSLDTVGNRMPISIRHIFNSNDRNNKSEFGLGWKSNYNQSISYIKIGEKDYYKYIDGDGTEHYFYYENDSKTYKNEEGLELTLKINADKTYEISDKGGIKSVFNESGLLKNIKDTNNNIIDIQYSGNKIQKIIDGAKQEVNFSYEGEKLKSLT